MVRSMTPFGSGGNGCWPFRGSQLPRALPHTNQCFAVRPPERPRRAARSFFKISRQSLLLSNLFLARLLILLLLPMSRNVHSNPGPIFPSSVCAGNLSWRGRSVQCCTCFKWVNVKCSLLSFSKFRTLGSSHS